VQDLTELPEAYGYTDPFFNEFGLYRNRQVAQADGEFFDADMVQRATIEDVVDDLVDQMMVHQRNVSVRHPALLSTSPSQLRMGTCRHHQEDL
jgi:hypothetical protein